LLEKGKALLYNIKAAKKCSIPYSAVKRLQGQKSRRR